MISINAVLGDNGLISQAEKAKDAQANAEKQDDERIGAYEQLIANTLAEKGGSSNEPQEKPLVTTVTTTTHEGIEAQDALGNPVKIPGGFKIASDSGSTVKEGIVIEDAEGNQFVWIPVSNINGDGSNKIKVDEDTEVEITLGRYTFDTEINWDTFEVAGTGEPTIVQKGSEWDKTETDIDEDYQIIDSWDESYLYELATKNEEIDMGEVAKDLEDFINSVEQNKGYYLARYEASYASGSSASDYKPASKASTNKTKDKWTPSQSTVGYLWNYISQADASKASQNMYSGDAYVESDLVNSYAWDTAIVYIQVMGNSNYANQGRGSNTSLLNTGETGDEKCKIFDMAGNLAEWTTEFCTLDDSPCSYRGGYYYGGCNYTANRDGYTVGYTDVHIGFRVLLYGKTGA